MGRIERRDLKYKRANLARIQRSKSVSLNELSWLVGSIQSGGRAKNEGGNCERRRAPRARPETPPKAENPAGSRAPARLKKKKRTSSRSRLSQSGRPLVSRVNAVGT